MLTVYIMGGGLGAINLDSVTYIHTAGRHFFPDTKQEQDACYVSFSTDQRILVRGTIEEIYSAIEAAGI